MKKIGKISILCILCVFVCGCAKREPDEEFDSVYETVDIQKLAERNGTTYEATLGTGEIKLSVNATVIIPSEIVSGTVETGYPAAEDVADAMMIPEMERETDIRWVSGSDGRYVYELMDDDAEAYFCDILLSKGTFDKALVTAENQERLKEQAMEIMEKLGYETQLLNADFAQADSFDLWITFSFMNKYAGTLIVTPYGFPKSFVSMTDTGVSEMILPKLIVKENVQPVSVIDFDEAVALLEKYYSDARFSPLAISKEIRYIRLAYFLDGDTLLPVWCFSGVIQTSDREAERVLYCINALDGEPVYDYMGDVMTD